MLFHIKSGIRKYDFLEYSFLIQGDTNLFFLCCIKDVLQIEESGVF